MFQNHLKIALRYLLRNKLFSGINIAGLAVGLSASIVIFLWIQYETSYNSFHRNHSSLYHVMETQTYDGQVYTSVSTPSPLAKTLKADFPEVADATRVTWGDLQVFHYNDKNIEEHGLFVDPAFLQMFTFPLLKGNTASALSQPNSLVLSQTTAQKYFGNEDPVGKLIRVNEGQTYQVTGVFADVPKNSTLRFDYLMPADDYVKRMLGGQEGWDSHNLRTFVQLKPGANEAAFVSKIKNLLLQHVPSTAREQLFLHPAKDWYLRNNFKNGKNEGGKIGYVKIFSVVAVFVLLIACINFMNLSTAQAAKRSKEVGVRKVIGGDRTSLLRQFLGESLLVTLMAAALSLVLVSLLLPVVNELLGKELRLPFDNLVYVGYFLLLILITAVLAGGYPAFVLSSFQPVRVLKGTTDGTKGGGYWLRRSLVVVQFVVSVVLMIGAVVVYQQIDYFRTKNIGYNRENLVYFGSGGIEPQHYEAFKNELATVKGVKSITRSSITFNGSNSAIKDVSWTGKQPGRDLLFDMVNSDYDMVPTLGIKLKEGRNFSKEYGSDTANVIINEEAARQMGLKPPVAGQAIQVGERAGIIVGVAEDFHITSLQYKVKPTIIQARDWTWTYFLRIDGAQTAAVLKDIERIYKNRVPDRPLNVQFMDKEYERMYRSEMQMSSLSKWFAGFAIFISCLGLFGLVSLAAVQRTKEIGIRKVLGATVANILALLSKDFLKLVFIASLIAFPLAWWAMNNWLQAFAYRITISPLVFVVAGFVSLLVALLTVSFLGLKAAVANPAKSLRTE